MKQWHPVPAEYAAALVKRTWSKDNQAPEAVAYLWTWSIMRNGVNVSIRDLANYTAWSKWKSRILLQRVKDDFFAWEQDTQRGGYVARQDSPRRRSVPPQDSHRGGYVQAETDSEADMCESLQAPQIYFANEDSQAKMNVLQEDSQAKIYLQQQDSQPHKTGQAPDRDRTETGQKPDRQRQRIQALTGQNQTDTGQKPDSNQTGAGRSRVIPHTNTNKITRKN